MELLRRLVLVRTSGRQHLLGSVVDHSQFGHRCLLVQHNLEQLPVLLSLSQVPVAPQKALQQRMRNSLRLGYSFRV